MLENLINAAIIKNIAVSERMKVYEASYEFDIENAPSYNYFYNIIDFIPVRDKITIMLISSDDRNLNFSPSSVSENDYNGFINGSFDDEIIEVKIRIDKEVKENRFSIYSFNKFAEDILSLSLEDVMIAFSNLLKQSTSFLIFDVYSPINMFATKSMFFIPYGENGNGRINSDFNRVQRIESCKEVSYFYNFDVYEILPDDFKIIVDYENNPLSELFQKITVLLSISFIATSATINEGQLKGIINGQRAAEYCCDINNLPYNNILYRIYDWIYTDGNAIDKAIIARNVISLHCRYAPMVDMDEKVIASIRSNYNLYLKDNVKEYLKLKNKVAEFISDIVSKTGEYAMVLLDKFKSNIIAIFGFWFTVIIANIVSNNPLDNIFTRDITVIMECILLGSFVYLIICCKQFKYEMNKVYESYDKLKKNYDGILTDEDLAEIFENDTLIDNMKDTINKSKRGYLILWVIFLVLIFIVVEIMSSAPTYQWIYELIKKICIKS